MRGYLTGPRATLAGGRADAVTVYLFGEEAGEWNWHLTTIPAYDHAAQMARLGQVSLTVDELGYGASGRPANGNLTCQGAEADVTHQIVQQLRHGTYTYASGTGHSLSFSKVALAGHDVGGQVAEIEAYSYADIDGLVLVTWADQGFTPWIIERETVAANDWCTSSADGYVHFVSSEEYRTLLFQDAEPAVVAATDALRNPNPCGNIRSQPTGIVADTARVAQITVPVLVVYGDKDTLIWSRQGEEQQASNFRGSSDTTTAFIPDASHFPMFERTAPTFRQLLASWLDTRITGRHT
jgi:pimeloyl-ACP methyl ester carboxylesterase